MSTTPKAPLVERLRGGVYGVDRIALCREAATELETICGLMAQQAGLIERLTVERDQAREEASAAYLAHGLAAAERDALREAVQGLMNGNEWRCIQGDWGWHIKSIPSNAALTAAQQALKAAAWGNARLTELDAPIDAARAALAQGDKP